MTYKDKRYLAIISVGNGFHRVAFWSSGANSALLFARNRATDVSGTLKHVGLHPMWSR